MNECFLLGTIIGGAIAVLLWSSPTVSKIMDPYLVVLNSLPKVALAPIIIFWVGNGTGAIIVITLLISLVTTIISVLTGFNEVDTGKIILMKTFKASKMQILRHCKRLPHGLRNIRRKLQRLIRILIR